MLSGILWKIAMSESAAQPTGFPHPGIQSERMRSAFGVMRRRYGSHLSDEECFDMVVACVMSQRTNYRPRHQHRTVT
jgi:hypothetical protein